jgi:hypothetical protein
VHRLKEIERVVMPDAVDIDDIGVAPRLPADNAIRCFARHIDCEGEPVADRLWTGAAISRRVDEPHLGMQPPQCRVAKDRRAPADAQLHEP